MIDLYTAATSKGHPVSIAWMHNDMSPLRGMRR